MESVIRIHIVLTLQDGGGLIILSMTNWLSPSIKMGPTNGIPSIQSEYRRSMAMLVTIYATTNCDPYVNVSTVLYNLEYHQTSVLSIKVRIPM